MGEDEKRLSILMREGWDRRVAHDYRYWMSDGIRDDSKMWETGARDLGLLLQGIDLTSLKSMIAMELGCGVGRLLRPASEVFDGVLGVDVSKVALETARKLLHDCGNVKLLLGNGLGLSEVNDNSIDFVYSFAALSSMPVSVISTYIVELSRVLKPGAKARLQVYLGHPQPTVAEDSIAVRSFVEDNFRRAAEASGFVVSDVFDLVLPFEVSDELNGMVAKIVSLEKRAVSEKSIVDIQEILLPGGECAAPQNWGGSLTEYLMALARAEQHLKNNSLEEAMKALEFATENFAEPESQVLELLADIKREVAENREIIKGKEAAVPTNVCVSSEAEERFSRDNELILANRFPDAFQQMKTLGTDPRVSTMVTPIGEVVTSFGGVPMDNPQQAQVAADAWVEQLLRSNKNRQASEIFIVGFASAYHLSALLNRVQCPIHVIEPNPSIMRQTLAMRDCRQVISKISSLSFSLRDFEKLLETKQDHELCSFVVHPQTQAVARPQVDEFRRVYHQAIGFDKLRPSIGVVGPIYGGSLPIAGYVTRALAMLNQRVQYFDLSGFHSSFTEIDRFVRREQAVSALQSQYVEMLSQVILEGVTERPVDILISLAQAPLSGRVLTELRNRGTITAMWFVEDCRRFTAWKDISRYYDYMFLIQRDVFPQVVEAAGAGKAIYLPVACDPGVHSPQDLELDERARWGSDISFVGAGYNNRQQMFASLARRDFKIWGTEWPTCAPFDKLVQESGRRLTPDEYVKIFNASKINLNLHSSSERDGIDPNGDFVNPRVFELASCGAFQLADNRHHLAENLDIGSEIVTFDDKRDLEEKIDFYLANPNKREEVAAASRKRVLDEHTYYHRLKQMLGYILADKYSHLKTRVEQSPWPKTLKAAEEFPELHTRYKKLYDCGEEPSLGALVGHVVNADGKLSLTEQKLLFLHHVRSQTTYVNKLRTPKSA